MRRADFVALAAAAVANAPSTAVRAPAQATDTPSFARAVASIEALIARDRNDPRIAATGLPRLYTHGRPVRRSVILYHGFTNCPQQFDELAQRFFARGCNVYVPRVPFHGYRDRLTGALGSMTDPLLRAATTASYQAARGLGEGVSAVGLSLGGEMALFLAQTEPLEHAVPIAPFLMPIGVPAWFGLPAMRVVSWLPEYYVWWDPRIKAACLPSYAYPGFPSRALAECIFFGHATTQLAASAAPRARRCTLVINAHESAVNNAVARSLIDRWNADGRSYARVELAGIGPPRHDIIDPTTFPQARTLVYPALEAIVLGDD